MGSIVIFSIHIVSDERDIQNNHHLIIERQYYLSCPSFNVFDLL